MSRTVMLRRGIMLLAIGSLALCVATSAGAQTNLGKNKTGAQLYASVCANCHKSPQSLKPTGIFGLESFLGEHYTADRESAAAIATYLNGLKKTEVSAWSHRQEHEPSEALPAEAERIQTGHSFGYIETTR